MTQKRVLVIPLDWGLGHASRCIPVIQALKQHQAEVHIGGAGKSLALLQNEFPELKSHEFPAYAPVYPTSGSMALKLLKQVPRFLKIIRQEHIRTQEVVKTEGIDIIISDNRYGGWLPGIPSVFITHQLNVLPSSGMRWLRPILRFYTYRLIKKFSVCWVPDLPDRKFTGELSKPFASIPVDFIGTLSRFKPPVTKGAAYDMLILLSGPEPQRTIFEEIILGQLAGFNGRLLLVRGLIGESPVRYRHAHLEIVNSLDTEDLQQAIANSKIVIARSGYSTIMDLRVFQSKSILIPTPGQTEQLYLARKLHQKGIIFSCEQHELQVQQALIKAKKLKRNFQENDEFLLTTAIRKILDLKSAI